MKTKVLAHSYVKDNYHIHEWLDIMKSIEPNRKSVATFHVWIKDFGTRETILTHLQTDFRWLMEALQNKFPA